MKYVADPIILPDNASWQDIEDAKARAKWHRVFTREEMMARTNLDGKCGSCKKFCPRRDSSYGSCSDKPYYDYRQRTTPACKTGYERIEDGK